MKQFDIPEIIDDSFIIQFFSLQNTDKINPSRTKESFIKRFINIIIHLFFIQYNILFIQINNKKYN